MSALPQTPAIPSGLPAPAPSRILVVDDQPLNIHAMHRVFRNEHEICMATSGPQALEFCRATPPDLILMDVLMPGMNGLEVCRALKDDPATEHIPVIFVTGLSTQDEENRCWEVGCVDFITKPVNITTMRNRVRAHLLLKQQSDLLRQTAWLDGLTGLANRRQFDERLEKEWLRCQRAGCAMSLLVIDIDHFKRYNDRYGHLAGDDTLRRVAEAVRGAARRPGDLPVRLGGEEFVLMLPEIEREGARVVAERLEADIRALQIAHADGEGGVVTVSVGYATGHPSREDQARAESLVGRADVALYAAKTAGRARALAAE
ncbi:diguanylate cyclase domain-containing protein [Pseudoxanthomonas composti]|uniref:diguanylate cyclase n=1 Tax=Pseudoxanthomonas composti TaxID=2137479 RepID=A0A4Q1JVB4_9GAMM|nr:diguanylate cyclase [Pseudoxanthomonas composti]RXR06089.1 diguanylate cyclase [Pseudoxanthomonas composti]